MSSAPRGLAPREGLGSVLMKMGRAGPLLEPRRRPQAGKSGDPRSQNADKGENDKGIRINFDPWMSQLRQAVMWFEPSG